MLSTFFLAFLSGFFLGGCAFNSVSANDFCCCQSTEEICDQSRVCRKWLHTCITGSQLLNNTYHLLVFVGDVYVHCSF